MKSMIYMLLAASFASQMALANDVTCFTEKSKAVFGIKFNDDMSEALALESEDSTFLDSGLATAVQKGAYSITADLGRSGRVNIELNEVEGGGVRYQLYAGTAYINVFARDAVNTEGVEAIQCYKRIK